MKFCLTWGWVFSYKIIRKAAMTSPFKWRFHAWNTTCKIFKLVHIHDETNFSFFQSLENGNLVSCLTKWLYLCYSYLITMFDVFLNIKILVIFNAVQCPFYYKLQATFFSFLNFLLISERNTILSFIHNDLNNSMQPKFSKCLTINSNISLSHVI